MLAHRNSHYSSDLAELRVQEEHYQRIDVEKRAILCKSENRWLRAHVEQPEFLQLEASQSANANTEDAIDTLLEPSKPP
jgi:hypothetical protein